MATVTVETAHSRYVFDTEQQIFQRTPVHEDANSLRGDGEPITYQHVSGFQVGRSMQISHSYGIIRTTTPVLKVETVA